MTATIWNPGSTTTPSSPEVTPHLFIPGSAAAPGVSFVGDTNTGLTELAVGNPALAAGGAIVFDADNLGNLNLHGKVNFAQEISIGSAATTDIGSVASNQVLITGTTNITSFGTNYKGPMIVRFAGALTITPSATLLTPGNTSIVTSANATAVIAPFTIAGVQAGWNIVSYQISSGSSGSSASAGNLAGIVALSTSATLTLAQLGSEFLITPVLAGQVFTLPAGSTVTTGKAYWFNNNGNYAITIQTNGADIMVVNVVGVGPAYPSTLVLQPGDSTCLVGDGNAWIEQQGVRAVNGPTVRAVGPIAYSTAVTLTQADVGRLFYWNPGGSGNITLPASPVAGNVISGYCLGSSPATIVRNGTQLIYAQGLLGVTSISLAYGDSISLLYDGTSWIQISGAQQFGVGQTPQIQALGSGAGQRQAGTTYTNTFGKPIEVNIQLNATVTGGINSASATVAGVNLGTDARTANTTGYAYLLSFRVPVGATYSITVSNYGVTQWVETR